MEPGQSDGSGSSQIPGRLRLRNPAFAQYRTTVVRNAKLLLQESGCWNSEPILSFPLNWHGLQIQTFILWIGKKLCFNFAVDPKTLNLEPDPGFWPNLDPDPGFWPNLDPDPGLYNQFWKKKFKISLDKNNFYETSIFF